ncbi:enoyl-CoA hydratase/isomerase family protein [Spongiactinospora sp. TRM90649]|uniref:enoyl-CoA hydratase/isomerase family protein n=1 Tax=Spongiactinospora sp. TRM90649 TaxID=3031114 RepID=UPI0023F90AE6|nr:enoyl-CoA hydratase/isomerase family protein [Spongiactinospora sp. TRM90649]MDF5754832.1 enoyl-CoA hydratase/isomerase family protein [Spongiactinospora sp. TRM90649]
MDYATILYEVDDAVATVTLNRPEVMNALSADLERELHDALRRAGADPEVRAIILTGRGRAFCSGYDMSAVEGSSDPAARYPSEVISTWYERNQAEMDHLREIWSLSKPVIAAVNGWCMGGGFWYSLACDITIASSDAVFAQPEVRMTSSSIFLFAALCGWKNANRYALTGDHFDATEALRIGVVNEVVAPEDLLPAARRLARRIALVPASSVRLNKAITMLGLRASGLDSGLLLNGALNAMAHSSYGPDRERLNEAKAEGGLKAFLRARDEPFLPEPFGPKSAKPSE